MSDPNATKTYYERVMREHDALPSKMLRELSADTGETKIILYLHLEGLSDHSIREIILNALIESQPTMIV